MINCVYDDSSISVTANLFLIISFARQPSLMWNISQGCTTGTPAPMHGPPFATSVKTVCLGSHLTACPVKVSTNTQSYKCLLSNMVCFTLKLG